MELQLLLEFFWEYPFEIEKNLCMEVRKVKKFGWYLMGIVPLLAMLAIQFFGSVLFAVGMVISQGSEAASEIYTDQIMGVMLAIDLMCLLISGLWYYFLAFRKNRQVEMRRIKSFSWKTAAKILALAAGLQCVIQVVLSFWNLLDPAQMEEYAELMEESGITEFTLLTVIVVSIIGPIAEELFFRGLTMEYLKRTEAGFWVINAIQALMFGIAHLNLVQGTYAFLLGLALGYLSMRYETILAPIVLHICFNAYSVFMDPLFEALGIPDLVYNLGCAVVGAVLTWLALRWIRKDTEKVRMLVTGASGFLGSRIVRAYGDRYRVLAPSHEKLDLTDAGKVQRYLEKNRPQVVVHCAAVSDTGWCQQYPVQSRSINVQGTEHLAAACARMGSKLIFCSSDQIYFGSEVPGPHGEEDAVQPAGEYGRQKLEAEERCLAICPDTVCLRLCWMYDREQLSMKEHGNFLLGFLKSLRQGQAMVYPVYDFRGITDVCLVAEKLEQAFSLPGGVYNFGSANNFNMCETVFRLLQSCGISTERLVGEQEAFKERPRDIRIRTEKAEQFGIFFPDTLERLTEVLREMLSRR